MADDMKTPQNRFFRLLLDSVWFPAVAWVVSTWLFLGVGLVVLMSNLTRDLAPGHWLANGLLAFAALLLVVVATVTGLVAFVRSLLGRRWGRAALQLLFGVVAAVAAAGGAVAEGWLAYRLTDAGKWQSTPPDAPIPFAIESRRAHPYPGMHSKRIVFASGRLISLRLERGVDTDFAVYGLDSGRYAIADGLKSGRHHNVYRIDPVAQTVDYLHEGAWFRLPPDPVGIGWWRGNGDRRQVSICMSHETVALTNGTPAGEDFARRRYLGIATPGTVFKPAAKGDAVDPWADVAAGELQGSGKPVQ